MTAAAKLADAPAAKAFILAGNARVTLVSEYTGTRFTYRVRKAKDKALWFVALLTGDNNEADYTYLGTIFDDAVYRHGKKSSIGADAPGAKAFAYAWRWLREDKAPPHCEVWHEGRCGKCGRPLTVPESIATGMGPVCAAL